MNAMRAMSFSLKIVDMCKGCTQCVWVRLTYLLGIIYYLLFFININL